jgi:hypothetical protein
MRVRAEVWNVFIAKIWIMEYFHKSHIEIKFVEMSVQM